MLLVCNHNLRVVAANDDIAGICWIMEVAVVHGGIRGGEEMPDSGELFGELL